MEILCKDLIDTENFLPSPQDAYFHGLHEHLKIITWKLFNDGDIDLKPVKGL